MQGLAKAVEIPLPWQQDPSPQSPFQNLVLKSSLLDPEASFFQWTFIKNPSREISEKVKGESRKLDSSLQPENCFQVHPHQTWCETVSGYLVIVETGPVQMRENSRTRLIFELLNEIRGSKK